MTTERLEEFAVLANVLNYSKASEKLFISQPILSRHIKEMEKELQTTLFLRDTHGVHLTEEGKYLLKWVEPLLKKAERAVSVFKDEHVKSEGSVRISCEEQTLNTHVLTFIRSFQDAYQGISLKLSPHTAAAKKEQIFGSDIMLSQANFTETLRRDAQGAFLTMQEPLLAIPPYHHFGDMQEIRLEMLDGEDLIVPFPDEIFGPYSRNAMVANRKCHGTLRKISAQNTYEALLMVELGAGVMLIPHHLKHRTYPHTRTIPVVDPDCTFPVYAYLNLSSQNHAAGLFFDKLCEEFH